MTEKELNLKIGKNIKRYRLLYSLNKEDLKQKDLAKKVNVSVSLIGSLESNNNAQGISLYNLYNISKVLEVPIDKFFE